MGINSLRLRIEYPPLRPHNSRSAVLQYGMSKPLKPMRKHLVLSLGILLGFGPAVGCKQIYPCSVDGPVAKDVIALPDSKLQALLDEIAEPACAKRCQLRSTAEWGINWPKPPVFRRMGEDGLVNLAFCFDEGLALRVSHLDQSNPSMFLELESATSQDRAQIWPL